MGTVSGADSGFAGEEAPALVSGVGREPTQPEAKVPVSLETVKARLQLLLSATDLQGWPTYVVMRAYHERFRSHLAVDIGQQARVKDVLASLPNVRRTRRSHWMFFAVDEGPDRDVECLGVTGGTRKPSESSKRDWHTRLYDLVAEAGKEGLSSRDMEHLYWTRCVGAGVGVGVVGQELAAHS